MGDDEAAEEAYRSGIAAGDSYCHHNLGVLLADRGDLEGAAEQFALGAATGDQLAAQALRELQHGF
jgi:alkylation response protein AidB-like acyl-CoA dehydrogenase